MAVNPAGHDAPPVSLAAVRSTHPAGRTRVLLDIDGNSLELTRPQAHILSWLLRRLVDRLGRVEPRRP
nr:hypothetical protein [Micromonospora sp. DSM 115978]